MSDKRKDIIVLAAVITILLGIRFPKAKTLTLEEIKTNIKDTEKIYVCGERESRNVPCSKNERINVIKDEEKIRKLVDGMQNIGEIENPIIAGGTYYTLYFVNKDDKVIVSADYAGNIVFKTWKKEYVMNGDEVEKLNLKDLLGTKI